MTQQMVDVGRRQHGAGRRLRGLLLLGAGVATATAYVAAVDPNEPGHYLGCPFLGVTGQLCPGCGGLRAVHFLAHGELDLALGMNPLVVAMVPVAVVLWVWAVVRAVRGRPAWVPSVPQVIVLAVLIVGFWVLRNLPFAEPYLSRLT